jgi:hypothetical protein
MLPPLLLQLRGGETVGARTAAKDAHAVAMVVLRSEEAVLQRAAEAELWIGIEMEHEPLPYRTGKPQKFFHVVPKIFLPFPEFGTQRTTRKHKHGERITCRVRERERDRDREREDGFRRAYPSGDRG